ncbi:MAG: hypothetical protein QHG98_07460 [Methanothrix sp.]|jgi:hypothetical protein|nr:hypothetical protein [Methanothrix sp.]
MKPVVLVKLPSQNRFLGTFDTDRMQNWWISQPLPDSVAEVISSSMIYAQYHGCLCRMTDGSYAVFRSEDYGYTWAEAYRTDKTIYSMSVPDYGRVLLSQSDGWWESQNTGLDWAKVSSQAPGCKKVVSVSRDILLAHDGERVWKSEDFARNWRMVLNCRDFMHYRPGEYASRGLPKHNTKYNGPLYPHAFDAVYYQVLVGIGNMLVISDSQGEFWFTTGTSFNGKSGRILQIVHSDSWGPSVEHNRWLLRFYNTVTGRVTYYTSTNPHGKWTAKFDGMYLGEEAGLVAAYDVIRVGTIYHDRLIVAPVAVYYSKKETFVPSLRFSTDGGETWSELPVDRVVVYDPSTGTNLEGAYLEDSYAKFTWTGTVCHNSGRWVGDFKFERAQSVDFDTVLKRMTTKHDFDVRTTLAILGKNNVNMNTRVRKAIDRQHSIRVAVRRTIDKQYPTDTRLLKTISANYSMAAKVVRVNDLLHMMRAAVQRAIAQKYEMNCPIKGPVEKSYGFKTLLVSDVSDTIYRHIEELSPQAWDIRPPNKASRVVPTHAIDDMIDSYLEELK